MSRKNLPSNTSSYQQITILEDGTPFSPQFNDIYFDTKQGVSQSKVVFIDGNQLQTQWSAFTGNTFCIAETGFGTGLNFLLTLTEFLTWKNNNPTKQNTFKLEYISAEKFPLNRQQLKQALAAIPKLSQLAEQFIEQYPPAPSQNSTLYFAEDSVILKLHFDDALNAYQKLAAQRPQSIDAWFLDGFTPSKNPDMWTTPLYEAMATLSKAEASMATFTVAGEVRRGLEAVGFRLEKKQTHLFKENILIGKFQTSQYDHKGYKIRPRITKPQQVTIIGGGIASACLAYALTKNGVRVHVLCKDNTIASGASSNKIAAIYPLLHQTPDNLSEFYSQAFYYAKQTYQTLLADGFNFEHQWCGLVELAHNPAILARHNKFTELAAWPKRLVEQINHKQVSAIANIPISYSGLYFSQAGWVNPQSLITALFDAAHKTGRCKIKCSTQVSSATQNNDGTWKLNSNKGLIAANTLIMCAGFESNTLTGVNGINIYPVQGQVTNIQTTEKMKNLSTVLCHKGYVTPVNQGLHCIGATFHKAVSDQQVTEQDNIANLSQLHEKIPGFSDWQANDIVGANAKVRACTVDHLPLAGPVPDEDSHISTYQKLSDDKNWKFKQAAPMITNLYTLTGLGARGLCSAPLLADILTADICGTPYPVNQQQLFNLSPNRFVIKRIIKRAT